MVLQSRKAFPDHSPVNMVAVLHPYLAPLAVPFRRAASPVNAAAMQRYMKDIAPFIGIKTPQRRALLKQHIARYGPPPIADLPAICHSAFAQNEREWHYSAVDLLVRLVKKLGPEHLPLVEGLILTKSWWDTVDALAANVAGVILKRHQRVIPRWNGRWVKSDDLWLNRTSILYQLKWKADTDRDMLFANIDKHAKHPDFFIRKAIGWALREFAKTDPDAVRDFVRSRALSPLSVREAMKHL